MLAALTPLWALIFGIAGVVCLGIIIAIVTRGREAEVVAARSGDEPDLFDDDDEELEEDED